MKKVRKRWPGRCHDCGKVIEQGALCWKVKKRLVNTTSVTHHLCLSCGDKKLY